MSRPGVGFSRLLAAAVLLLCGSGAAFAAAKAGSSPEDALRAAEDARAQALVKADTAAISHLTADEFIEISRLGQLRTKADNLRDLASGTLKLSDVKYDSMTVKIYGTVAIVRAIADNTGTFRGFPFSGKIWYTRIFVQRAGRWQAVAMQHTMIQ